MPNSYAHLVFGKLFLEVLGKNKHKIKNIDLDNFYFGCIIPDINHISNIERRITHFYDANIFEFFEPKSRVEYSF
ncbi:hypothetical protein [Methanothermococcus okinawensis]|uniref:Uncharacterized protein n=1 Tax=Methanothermococcus okinawensis (strain DSM 14208 / JCM 11175 / IH1) TaxID=647113 RepID=F8AKT7_METOI|nr:hypothetical protein [Methanothermococcus okinawensis]AEH07559.1 hypothetical protein Metok_1596 [Methanothermococcus okinawensis IH1]